MLISIIIIAIYLVGISIAMYRHGFPSSGRDGEPLAIELSMTKQILFEEYDPALILSNNEYKRLLEKEFNTKLYIYKECELKSMAGETDLVFRMIKIRAGLSGIEYGVTLAHEMVHLNKYVANEKYVNEMTFKKLYQSKNKHLKNLAYYLGIGILNDKYPKKYICKKKIVDIVLSNKFKLGEIE